MAKNLYITGTEPRSGKSAISLGIMELLLRNLNKVAFFRPIVNIEDEQDKDIRLISDYYKLSLKHDDMYGYTFHEANEIIGEGGQDKLLEGILEKYKNLEECFDFVLCEGTDFESPDSAFELDLNIDIANTLSIPVLTIINAYQKNVEQIVSSTKVTLDEFKERHCEVIAAIINRAQVSDLEDLKDILHENIPNGERLIYAIPENLHLSKPSMKEIAHWLNAEVLHGEEKLNRHVYSYMVAGMRIKSFLGHIQDRSLVIVPGDREDIILSCLLSLQSSYFPNIAGILLTEGLSPDETMWRLIKGLSDFPMPILRVKEDTFSAAMKVNSTYAGITPDNKRKLTTVLRVFESHVDTEELGRKIALSRSTRITPKIFEYGLLQKARSTKKHIVLPEGIEARILKAAEILLRRKAVELTVLGDEQKIHDKICQHALHLDDVIIIDPVHSPHFEDYVNRYYELRKHKGATLENSRDVMADPNYFGTMMVYQGHADGMVSGSINTTRHTIRPAFEFIRTKEGFSIVSSVFFMCLEDRVLVYGDCAINPNPSAEQLAEIAISSAETAKMFSIEPRVAMLSYSTGSSGTGQDVLKVSEATKIAQERRPDLKIEGPLQYDAAIDASVAMSKMPDSEVAGKATVFIFPDLNTGNNTYKAVQRSANALAIGPLLQGLRKPVNDLSRGCTVADIVNTVAMTAIQAQFENYSK